MIEPPQSGFTGVVWEAREPDRLARDLSTGPGPLPMAEAGAAWGHLAGSFGAAVVEFESILVALQGAWRSATSAGVHDQVSTLRDWLSGAAQAAGANAAKAQEQAAANELARLTMPNIAEIELIIAAQHMLQQIGGALGAPIQAIAAVTDTDSDAAKAAAARVMRIYEAATEPLATPWVQDHPPVLSSGTALAAEHSGVPGSRPSLSMSMPQISSALPPGFDPASLTMPPPVQTAFVAPSYVESETAQDVPQVVPAGPAGQIPATAMPGPVGAPMTGASAMQAEPGHRAGLTIEGTDAIGIDNGIVSAPAVLGGTPATPTTTRTAPPAQPAAQPGAA